VGAAYPSAGRSADDAAELDLQLLLRIDERLIAEEL
jgi:hypothetical protein